MVVEHVRLAGRNAEVGEQLLALVGLAVAVGVAENGQIGHVHDVERAVVPDHAEDGAEPVGEDDRVFARRPWEDEDAVAGLVSGPTWSIGSSATKREPSGAVATWQGYCTAGTAATRRIWNPSGTLGRPSAKQKDP